MNNYRFKHIFGIISSISSKSHSCLDVSNEIIFVKNILTAVGYEMLHDELLFFAVEIENKKVIFQRDNALIHTAIKL